MQRKLYLFGTGKIAQEFTFFFDYMSIEIEGYIDNDRCKWGGYFYNKKIYSPDTLCQIEDFCIFIACAAKKELILQLSQMNLEKHIISMKQIINVYGNSVIARERFDELRDGSRKDKSIIIDNLGGTWGGAEDWSHIVALSLAERKYEVNVIEQTQQPLVEDLRGNTLCIDTDKMDEYHIYMSLIKALMKKKPFILFNVKNSELLWAAVTIKQVYPDDVCVISSILNDAIYEEFYEWDNSIDLYLCISSRIQENLINICRVNQRKVFCRTPFIEKIRKVNKAYHVKGNEPLKVVYPCRLVVYQKRADLIPSLIEYLEEKKVHYLLNIVGDGPCEDKIKEYVELNHLHSKVKMLGRLSREELCDFLNQQDVYLNFSEFEGTSLTMLEAMASGCVPVVTNVSGVSDFIENRINGLVADVGDLEKISGHIAFLDKNRHKLVEYGNKSMSIVQEKCRLSDYIDDIENIIKLV